MRFLIAVLIVFVHAASASAQMNVVVVVSDDHRWDSLAVAGNNVILTPHLDALAGDGIRFTNAFVTTSICMTSRASIMTGQYMSRHGIDRFGKPLTSEQFSQSYLGQLRQSGYWSGFVGKYGVGAPQKDDFDFLRAYEGRHWMERNGERVHVTELNRRDAIEFLQSRPTDKPFLLSLSFFAPHAEDRAPEQYLPQDWSQAFYEGKNIPRSNLMDDSFLQSLPPFLSNPSNEGRIRYHWRFDTQDRYQQYMTNYYRLITEVDHAIGDVIQTLKDQGVFENTLIVFIGDNGYFHADRGLADKWYPYEQALRVPLIIHDPRLPQSERGTTRDVVALNIDVAPTVISAVKFEFPSVIQGNDLSKAYLQPVPKDWRTEFFYEHPTITNRDRIPSSQGVIGPRYKYIVWPEWDHEQLFDLEKDPSEKQNLVERPEYQQVLQDQRHRFQEWKSRVQ